MPTNAYGLSFSTQKEMEAWEAYVDARLEAAEQTPLISHEEALKRLKAMQERWNYVPDTMAR